MVSREASDSRINATTHSVTLEKAVELCDFTFFFCQLRRFDSVFSSEVYYPNALFLAKEHIFSVAYVYKKLAFFMCYMSKAFNLDNELVFVLLAKTKRNKIILKFRNLQLIY